MVKVSSSAAISKESTPLNVNPLKKSLEKINSRFSCKTLSCRASKKPELFKPQKIVQSAKLSPRAKSNQALQETIRQSPYELKPRTKTIKGNNTRKILQKDPSPTKKQAKSGTNDFVTQVNAKIFDVPERALTEKEIHTISQKIHKAHLVQTFYGLKAIEKFVKDAKEPISSVISLPPLPEKQKTVVFDLDETLVHCVEAGKGNANITVSFPSGESITVGINIRPYTKECLEVASKLFEVIVFTASHKSYADAVLDYLDPKRSLIHHRLYREHCVIHQGIHIKDLRVLGNRKISNIIIIDNAVHSFAFQIDNGIPIITWHNNPHDTELFKLIDYLKALSTVPDIRVINRKTFKLKELFKENTQSL